eukprot:scaffold100_cov323-Pavlova_lutheri.AAC.25
MNVVVTRSVPFTRYKQQERLLEGISLPNVTRQTCVKEFKQPKLHTSVDTPFVGAGISLAALVTGALLHPDRDPPFRTKYVVLADKDSICITAKLQTLRAKDWCGEIKIIISGMPQGSFTGKAVAGVVQGTTVR